ncbi:MAG: hypothetical protein R8P61_32255 [Bacteroidia bacterium]|nr:hypothetical protein [Bacteroidia bacterium]
MSLDHFGPHNPLGKLNRERTSFSNKTGFARTTIGKYISITLERADIKEA